MVSALQKILPFQVFFVFTKNYMLPVCCMHDVSTLYKINHLNDKIFFQRSPIVLLNHIYIFSTMYAQCMHAASMLYIILPGT